MKKKMLATAGAAAMMLGLFGAGAADAAPGPNEKNNKGLCTAYFNGSDTGRANKRGAPPFAALEAAAAAEDQTVEEFCGVVRDEDTGEVTDDGLVGGNPDYDDPGPGNNNRGGGKG